jgi:hypothetical protein
MYMLYVHGMYNIYYFKPIYLYVSGKSINRAYVECDVGERGFQ